MISVQTGIAIVCIVWPLAVFFGFWWLDSRGELDLG